MNTNREQLETVMESEAKLLLETINKLQNDDLYDFIRELADLDSDYDGPISDIIGIARNIRNIENTIEEFYVR
jgi:hypothetical protein